MAEKATLVLFFVSIGQILGGIQNEKMENNEEKRLKRKKEK